MSGACMIVESSKTYMYCMASWLLDPDLLEGLFSGTKMSVNKIWRQATSTQQTGKPQLQITAAGDSPSSQASKQANWRERNSGRRRDNVDGRGRHQHPQSQVLSKPAATATRPAAPELDCTVTAGTATQPRTDPQCIFHCLPSKTDANNNNHYNHSFYLKNILEKKTMTAKRADEALLKY